MRSQLDSVVKYIENQEEHHSRRTFKDEYLCLLKRFKVDYDDRYLFQWIEQGELEVGLGNAPPLERIFIIEAGL